MQNDDGVRIKSTEGSGEGEIPKGEWKKTNHTNNANTRGKNINEQTQSDDTMNNLHADPSGEPLTRPGRAIVGNHSCHRVYLFIHAIDCKKLFVHSSPHVSFVFIHFFPCWLAYSCFCHNFSIRQQHNWYRTWSFSLCDWIDSSRVAGCHSCTRSLRLFRDASTCHSCTRKCSLVLWVYHKSLSIARVQCCWVSLIVVELRVPLIFCSSHLNSLWCILHVVTMMSVSLKHDW